MNIKRVLLLRINSLILEEVNHPHQFYPPFLLKYIQAILNKKAVYQTQLIDCYVRPIPFNSLLGESLQCLPDMVVIFFASLNANLSLKYARAIKERCASIITVAVGPEITLNYQNYCNSELDFILPGEVEKEVPMLIENLNRQDLKSAQKTYDYRDNRKAALVYNINELPIPAYSLDELFAYRFLYPIKTNKKLVWGHILANRGCSHKCIFCSQNTRESFSKEVRIRSVSNVAGEIQNLLCAGANFISFADDDFTISNEFVYSLCNEIKDRGLRIQWTAQARIDEVDYGLLETMKEVGCALLAFGIESGSKRIINILNKNDFNIDWIEKAKIVFKICRELGIATVALFIIGNPTEKEEDIRESIKLAKELNPDIIQVHFFTLYPGSPAYQQYRDKITGNFSNLYHYAQPVINVSDIDLKKLERMQVNFYRNFLLRPNFIFNNLFTYTPFYFHNKDVFWILCKKTLRLILGNNS
jgi:radical SAM superfamily enzyme YgiQ (UPF0313 family)